VNPQQATDYLHALIASVTIGVIVPGLMFLAMALLFIWVVYRAQGRHDFDASQFLRDEAGQLSSVRLFAFVAVAAHTWVIAVETMAARITPDQMLIYAVTWSASLVLSRAVDKWNGALPWAKGPSQ
jgi:cbb3-type cytochrome oxidase subunit 3